jgi:hypothetical protein
MFEHFTNAVHDPIRNLIFELQAGKDAQDSKHQSNA